MRFDAMVIFAAWFFLAVSVSTLAMAGPPAGVQGATSRDITRSIPTNQPDSGIITVGDPKKAEAIGLPGLKEGDKVKVSRDSNGKWVIKDPATGKKAVLDHQPDLGR